jgi:NAD(P)-dependent dehydrogenase (short-subunit alcohol dehydrogenase family)
VDTPGVTGLTSDAKQRAAFDAMHPVGRMGRPEEIAHAAVYFASEESAWTTGSILSVDGGVTAQ